LLDDPVHTETARLLPGWKVQECFQEVRCDNDRGADTKHAARCPPAVADRFMHAALEGVGAQVHQGRPRLRSVGVLPNVESMRFLDHEVHLVVLVANCCQFPDISKIEDFFARAFFCFALEERQEVVPIQVNFEGFPVSLVAFLQLLFHIGHAGGQQCR